MKFTNYSILSIIIFLLGSCGSLDDSYKNKSKSELENEELAKSLGLKLDEWEIEKDYYRVNSNATLVALSKEKAEITHLKFHHSNRDSDTLPLPIEIGKFTELTHLVIYSLNTNEIPNSITNLKKLRSLTIRIPTLKHIPESIGNLKSLEELIISFADDTEIIPSEIFQLPNLIKLELSRIHQETVQLDDDAFSHLINLEELIIHDTRMKIPKSINRLKKLKILDLALYYGDVPKEAYELDGVTNLKLYSISENEMDGIGKMKSVQQLQIMDGNIISKEIAEMQNLEELIIWKTYTDEFPIELNRLDKLSKLKIVGTSKFKKVPEFIYGLKSLNELTLVGCDSLKTIDDRILEINQLNKIELSSNKNLVLTEKQKRSSKIKKY